MKLRFLLRGTLPLLCAAALVLPLCGQAHSAQPNWAKAQAFGNGFYVAGQITAEDIPAMHAAGFATVVDVLPDGEQPDQIPSVEAEKLAKANHMSFFYAPVGRGPVPADSVATTLKAITASRKPVLLYCRSGHRATSVLALALASMPNGPDAASILQMAKAAGHPIDALKPEIDDRIAHRAPATPGKK